MKGAGEVAANAVTITGEESDDSSVVEYGVM